MMLAAEVIEKLEAAPEPFRKVGSGHAVVPRNAARQHARSSPVPNPA